MQGGVMSGSDGIPPGWYPDPDGKPCERFWDGQSWGADTRPQRAFAAEEDSRDGVVDDEIIERPPAQRPGRQIGPVVFYTLTGVGLLAALVVWFVVAGNITGPDPNPPARDAGAESSDISGGVIRAELDVIWAQLADDERSNACQAFLGGAPFAVRGMAAYYDSLQQFDREAVLVETFDYLQGKCGAPAAPTVGEVRDCQWSYVADSVAFAGPLPMDCRYNQSRRRYTLQLCLPLGYSDIGVERSGSGLSISSANPRSLGNDRRCRLANRATDELWEFSVSLRTARLANIKVTNGDQTVVELVPDVASSP